MNERNQHTDKSESEQIKERVAHFARRARLNKQMREQKARGEEPLWPTDMAQPEVFPALGRTGLKHPNSFKKPQINRSPVSDTVRPESANPSLSEVSESLARNDGSRFYSAPSFGDKETEVFKIPVMADSSTEPIPVISGAEQNSSNEYDGVLSKIKEIAEDRPTIDESRGLDHSYIRRAREGLREALVALPTDASIEQVYSMIDELSEAVLVEDGSVFHRRLGDVIRELERLSRA